MYGDFFGDAIPRHIATTAGKIRLHHSSAAGRDNGEIAPTKPWSEETVTCTDADPEIHADEGFTFTGIPQPP